MTQISCAVGMRNAKLLTLIANMKKKAGYLRLSPVHYVHGLGS